MELERRELLRVAGRPAVETLFRVAPERIVRLFFTAEAGGAFGPICAALAKARKPYRQVEPDELARIAGTPMHGGVVALAEPRPVARFDPDAAAAWAGAGQALLVLDGIGNPHNLGAIARTAAFFGAHKLLLSEHKAQAMPSDAAYRVARGGLDHIDVYRADDIAAVLAGVRPHYRVVGAALGGTAVPLERLVRDGRPVALVLGNEEGGLPATTLAACETVVEISGSGAVQSLNVAASAAILIHALLAVRPT